MTQPTALHDIDAEFTLLGCLLSHADFLERVAFLAPEHFASPSHCRIYATILRRKKKGDPINPFTVAHDLAADTDLELTGGAKTYLASAVGASLVTFNYTELARHVVELAQKRALRQACEEAVQLLENDITTAPADASIALARQFELVSRGYGAPRVQDDYEVAEEILQDLKTHKAPTSTGIPYLDEAMGGGLFPGKAYGFAARKKVGKTILASTISCNLGQAGVPHLFVCGEMSAKEIHQRTLCRLTDSYPSAFRSDYGQSPEFQRKIAIAMQQSKRCAFYHNAPGLTIDELRRSVVGGILGKRVKGFILDYWQLVGGKSAKKGQAEHLDEVAQWIADTCRKYDVWAVVMAQINQDGNTRGGEGIRPAPAGVPPAGAGRGRGHHPAGAVAGDDGHALHRLAERRQLDLRRADAQRQRPVLRAVTQTKEGTKPCPKSN